MLISDRGHSRGSEKKEKKVRDSVFLICDEDEDDLLITASDLSDPLYLHDLLKLQPGLY